MHGCCFFLGKAVFFYFNFEGIAFVLKTPIPILLFISALYCLATQRVRVDARVFERPPRISLEQVGNVGAWIYLGSLSLSPLFLSLSLSSSDALKRDGRNKIAGRRRAGWRDSSHAKYSSWSQNPCSGYGSRQLMEPYTLMLPIFLRDFLVTKLYAPRSTKLGVSLQSQSLSSPQSLLSLHFINMSFENSRNRLRWLI